MSAKIPFGDLYALPSRNGLTRPSAVRGIGYRMAAMGEIFASDYVGGTEMDRVQLNERELSAMMLQEDDLLFARQSLVLSGAGKCAIVRGLTEPTTFESHLIRVRLDTAKANPLFYMYYFRSNLSPIKSIVQQGVQAGIRGSDLNALMVDYPEKQKQDRIAAILSDYDAAIANCRRQVALLEEAAQRLYRESFAEGKGEKWPISKWFDVTIGRTPPRKMVAYFSNDASDMAWCSIADIKNTNVFVFDTAERLTKQALDDSKIHISPTGTILLSFKLTVGRVAIASVPITTNEAIAHFETTDRAFRDYTYCYLRDFKYETLGSTSAIGTAINSEIVRSMPFLKPSDEAIGEFSKKVSPMFDQIEALSRQIRALTEARDRLLPKLMSGEVSA